MTIDDLLRQLEQFNAERDRLLAEKDDELAILQSGMDQTLLQLAQHQQVGRFPNRCHITDPQTKNDTESIYDSQIDTLLLDQVKKLNEILGK